MNQDKNTWKNWSEGMDSIKVQEKSQAVRKSVVRKSVTVILEDPVYIFDFSENPESAYVQSCCLAEDI